jgi:hypothetical protein
VSGAPAIELRGFQNDEYEQKLNNSEEPKWKTWRETLYALHRAVSQEMLAPWFSPRFLGSPEAGTAPCPFVLDVKLSYYSLKGSKLSPLDRKVTFAFKNPSSGELVWSEAVEAGRMSPTLFKSVMRERTREGIEIAYRLLLAALTTKGQPLWTALAKDAGRTAWLHSVQGKLQASLREALPEQPPYTVRGVATEPDLLPEGDLLLHARRLHEEIPATASPRPHHYAVVIGMGEYRNDAPLPYAAHDAQRMQVTLVNAAGVPQENCFVLTDAARKPWERLLKRRLPRKVRAGGVLWFYYRGRWMERGGTSYLLARDADPETGNGLMSLAELVGKLQALDVQRVMLLLDAEPASFVHPEKEEAEHVALFMLEKKDRYPFGLDPERTLYLGMLASQERPARSSLFTYAVAEGLQGGRADGDDDGFVTARELYRYTEGRIGMVVRGGRLDEEFPSPIFFPERAEALAFPLVRP